jgi:GTP-binding protein
MLPVVAIIGRPNVGKSTLFNMLTKTRNALVADQPGLTRDRIYGQVEFASRAFIIVDTGGIGEVDSTIEELMAAQAKQAMLEADLLLFIVDAKAGLTAADQQLAREFRGLNKPILLAVNKTDGLSTEIACADFHALALGEPIPIAAAHSRGINSLLAKALDILPQAEQEIESSEKGIKTAIIGRPNVGKSTLVNRMLGEERVVVCDMPGTTRDSVFIPLERHGEHYIIIDTAGVRRRGKISETIEKFSVVKTLQAIEAANVVIMVFDAREGIVDHDLNLLGFVLEAGKALILAINKWDGLQIDEKDRIKEMLNRKLGFVDFAPLRFISALHGTGVGDLFKAVQTVYQSATKKFSTTKLTELLQKAVAEHSPPLVHGRRIKLRYAHTGGHNPPIIVVHGNQVDAIPTGYQRYLINFYRDALKLKGTPIRVEFKGGENPFAGRKNKLTARQVSKRKRLMRHIKRKWS